MYGGGKNHEEMEELVGLAQNVAFAGEATFREASHVNDGAQNVEATHQNEPMERGIFKHPLETVSEGQMDGRDNTA